MMNDTIQTLLQILSKIEINKDSIHQEWLDGYQRGYRVYRNKITNNVYNGNKEDYYDNKEYYQTLYDTHEQIKKQVKQYKNICINNRIWRISWYNWAIRRSRR